LAQNTDSTDFLMWIYNNVIPFWIRPNEEGIELSTRWHWKKTY